MLVPGRIREGDTVAIVSPSFGASDNFLIELSGASRTWSH